MLVAAAGLVLSLGGCKVGPDYQGPPAVETPDAFSQASSADSGAAVRATPAPVELAQWWEGLNDPALTDLIDRAVAANLDLRIAASRVAQARAQRGIVASERLPTVNANGSYRRSRASENGNFVIPEATSGSDLYSVGFDAIWELDFWGRIGRNVEAADADIAAAVENQRDVLITLTAEVARNYVELRALQGRLRVAENAVRVQEDTIEIVSSRFNAGVASELDQAQAQAQLDSRRSQVPPLRTAIEQTIHRLSVLLGRPPASLQNELRAEKEVPVPPSQIGIGVPSELLRRRADIRRAERQIAAATARIGVATAEYFPRFTIVGEIGLQSNRFGRWAEGDSRFWSIGPGMQWPIFNAGRIAANVEVQRALVDEAAAFYERTVLGSFEEVENALVQLAQEQQRLGVLESAIRASRRAVELADERYRAGTVDFRTVLENQRTLYETEDQYVQSRGAVTTSAVALYKALGGGWNMRGPAGESGVSEMDAAGSPSGVEAGSSSSPPGSAAPANSASPSSRAPAADSSVAPASGGSDAAPPAPGTASAPR